MSLDIEQASPEDDAAGLDIQPASTLDVQPVQPLDVQPANPHTRIFDKVKKYARMAAGAAFPELSSSYEGLRYAGQKAAQFVQDPVNQAVAKEVWNRTPMGVLNNAINAKLTPAVQGLKSDVKGAAEWAGLTPSDEEINWGAASKPQLAAKVATDTLADQVPESTYGIAAAYGIPKALGAVSEYAPKVFPVLGKDIGGPIAQRIAAMLGHNVPQETPSMPGPAQASPSAPADLPVMAAGANTGEPHALFSYNDNFGADGQPRSLYTVFGDPEHPAIKQVGYRSTVNKAQLDAAGIPIVGREARTLGKFDPLDLPPPPPTPPQSPSSGATPPREPFTDESPEGMGSLDKLKQALVEPYQAIKFKPGEEIAPGFKDAMGDTTGSYNAASVMQGKVAGKARQIMGDLDTTLEPLQNHAEYKAAERIAFLENMKDLAAQGKTTAGYTPGIIQNELGDLAQKLGPEDFTRLSSVGRQFSRTASYIKLGEFVDAGMIKPERAQQLFEEYPNYVPSQIIDDEAGILSQPQPSALGKVNARMLMAKKGTTQAINENAFEAIRKGVVEGVAAAEKQRVVNQVAQEFATPIGGRTYEDGFLVKKVNPKAIPPGYVESSIKTGDNKIYAVHKDVENLLQGLNQQSADLVTKAMSQYNRIFREGATLYRAPFVMNHAWRSFSNSALTHRAIEGQGKFIPAMAKGLVASVSDALGIPNELFQQFERAGGGYGGMYTNITSEAGLPFRLKSLGQKVGTVFHSPLAMLGKAVRVSDNIMRVAEFERLKNLPADLQANNARMVGIDFAKQGDAMKLISKWIPFLNDKVQADWNFVNSAKAQPGLMMGRLAAGVAAPTIALHQYNKQFAEDDLIDPGIRQHYFYAIIPDPQKSAAAGHLVAKTIDNNGRQVPMFFRMPKIGPIRYFSNILDGYLKYADKSPVAGELAKTYAPGHLAQEFAGEVMPPALKLPAEQASNYQLWNGRPIVREGLQNKSLPLQFDSGTSNTARLLGQATDKSPVRIEHAVRSVFPAAGTGMELSDMAMKGLQKAGVNVPQPLLPRQDKSAFFQSREFQPYVAAPSGGYSVEEAQAKDAQQQIKQPQVDARFMARESLLRFRQDPTDENRARVETYWNQLSGQDKSRISKMVEQQLQSNTLSPMDRATMKAPKNLREMIGALVHKKGGLDLQPASRLDVQ